MKFTIISLFNEALKPYLDSSMLYKAQEIGAVEFEYVNLRDFGLGPHKSVDDTPYGGGDGMLLRCEPVYAAIESVKAKDPAAEVILPTPVGKVWNQRLAKEFAFSHTIIPGHDVASARRCGGRASASSAVASGASRDNSIRKDEPHYVILCPHYEGYDERILEIVDHKISLGNYILTGGELPALIIIDSIVRLLPGVLGGETSAEIESFSDGDNLEFPQYTKPAEFRGMKVPEVLLSGHHGKVDEWRKEHSGKAML